MAKIRAGAGEIVEEVKQTRVITPEEQSNRDDDPSDAFEYMAAIPLEERSQYIVYIYRTLPVNGGGYIQKIEPPIDEEFFRTNFGGGTYKFMVKRGSELKRRGQVTVVGEPIAPGAVPVRVAGDVRSEIVQIIQELNRTNPQGMTADLMKAAFLNALDIQKAAAMNNAPMKPNEMIAMMKDMYAMNGGGSSGGGLSDNPMLKDFFTALIPIGVGLISKFLTPTDPLQSITQMSSLITAARQLGDGGGNAAKEDLANVIVKNGPGLLAEGSKFLAELRAATQLRIQTEALNQNRTIPVVGANPALHTPPAPPAAPAIPVVRAPQPTPAAASVNAAVEDGAPTPQYILRQVKQMIERGETAGFVLDYLDENLPQIIDNMRMATPEQLKMVIASDEILGPVVKHEKFEAFFADFVKLLHEKPPDAPATTPLPN